MIQSASHLASLIGSLICHDLISPIGAIHNGLELISLSGAVQHEAEISLITQSCQNAAAFWQLWVIKDCLLYTSDAADE